jgi:peptide chain release factor 2
MITSQELQEFATRCKSLIESQDISNLQQIQRQLEIDLESPDIWSDTNKITLLQRSLKSTTTKIKSLQSLNNELENLEIAFELNDEVQCTAIYIVCQASLEKIEIESFLRGKFDDQGATLSIHAGAGGLDAKDWVYMMSQMYQKFFTRQGWECSLISLSEDIEGGYKSISFEITGEFVYGYLKEEAGVHRLVRISPFNSGKTRETSFALVEVLPNNLGESIGDMEIAEKDLKWEYSMSSGKGGQSVNTTYSAVRLVHIPTNTSVTCQNERSQLQNKQQALKYLRNKLAAQELQKHKELQKEVKGNFVSAEWGSQIRSYTLHPYKLIKDHRSGWETSNISEVLENGTLMDVIWSIKRL